MLHMPGEERRGKKSVAIHKVTSPPLNTGSKMYLQLLTSPACHSYHKKYVFKTSSPLTFNPTKAKIDTLIEKYKIKISKNKMVAWNVIFTQKRSPFELPQLYKHFHIYNFGCSPVLTEVNGILRLTSLGTGAGSTWTIFASLKSHGSGEKRA